MEPQRWKVDLHAHTWHSRDCPVSPERLVRAAKRRGLNGIAITNHNRFAGHEEAQRAAGSEFIIIPGEEVFSSAGEIIGLFLTHEIPGGLSPEATAEAIRAQGGIVVMPHPFDRYRRGAVGETVLNRLNRAGLVDAVEVFNGRMMHPLDNGEARRWALAHDVAVTIGSDGHSTWEYGASYNVIAPFTNAESFKANLRGAMQHRHRAPQWVHFVSTFEKRRRVAREMLPSANEATPGNTAPRMQQGMETHA